tara:strand:- start:30 stop:341 length:312 start_codon:yes stop_codon:yes gene_type:complete
MNLTLSDTAYKQIGHLLEEHNKKFVRLQVKGGGCAGFEYEWSFEDEQGKDDHLIDDRLLIDQMNELYLTGIEIDYNKETFGSAFTFNNPQAKSQCGCGTSFSV